MEMTMLRLVLVVVALFGLAVNFVHLPNPPTRNDRLLIVSTVLWLGILFYNGAAIIYSEVL